MGSGGGQLGSESGIGSEVGVSGVIGRSWRVAGQPTPGADGDDLAGSDAENGNGVASLSALPALS
jgi:hypothetical protein